MLISTGTEMREPRTSAATPQERAAQFTRLYESRAYLVYNVALRITCEHKTALAAAETAFLRQAVPGTDEASLLPAAVAAATGQAARKPKPSGVGESELPLLHAAASLPAPERAALALTIMADLPIDETGAILQLGHDAAADLVGRATEGFAAAAGIDAGALYDLYVEWGWADPPSELWERVYPAFRRAIDDAPAGVAAQTPAAAPRGGRGIRRRLVTTGTVVIAGVAAAAIMMATQGGSSNGADNTASTASLLPPPAESAPADPVALPEASGTGANDPVAAVQAKPHKPLNAKELDQLRLNELAALRNYESRQSDKRLSRAQRNYAASKVNALRELARQRAEVKRHAKELASRERALARAQDRIRRERVRNSAKPAKQQHQADAPAADSKADTAPAQPQAKPPASQPSSSSGGGGDGSAPATHQQDECVQDAGSGTYICPEG
jgi:hypothetical protein